MKLSKTLCLKSNVQVYWINFIRNLCHHPNNMYALFLGSNTNIFGDKKISILGYNVSQCLVRNLQISKLVHT